jgi:hypothetical protein
MTYRIDRRPADPGIRIVFEGQLDAAAIMALRVMVADARREGIERVQVVLAAGTSADSACLSELVQFDVPVEVASPFLADWLRRLAATRSGSTA